MRINERVSIPLISFYGELSQTVPRVFQLPEVVDMANLPLDDETVHSSFFLFFFYEQEFF